MTPPRPPRTSARATLDIIAAGALTVALVLLIPPACFTGPSYGWPVSFLAFIVIRLSIPLGLFWILRWCLSAPGDLESGAARICARTGICVVAAGISWMSEPGTFPLGYMTPGRRDIPWVFLLVASESARLAVMRGSVRPRVVAIGAFALALGSSLALGSDAIKVDRLKSLPMRAFGSIYALVAAHPWIAMICLAGLWLWVGLADRRRAAPTSAPE